MLKSQKTKSYPSERIRIKCLQCHSRLCDRLWTDKGYVLHFKKKHINLYTDWMVITCPTCATTHEIEAKSGLKKSVREPYIKDDYGITDDNERIQAENADTAHKSSK